MDSRFFAGPVGRLDARLHGPTDGVPVLLCHPHPLFGGTMGSRLVYDLAVGLALAGYRAVRFDYRGVGRSDGSYGRGDGEVADALALFDAVAAETGQVPAVVGYSFGGGVACRLATLRTPARLIVIAAPSPLTQSTLVPTSDAPNVRCPVALLYGDRDELAPPEQASAVAAAFRPPAKLTMLEGAAHFLEPSHNPRAVAAVLEALAG
ncbi:MAG: alpha/beta fold hydrolase [Candidatus Thermoplasmatota archaeon]